MLKIKRRAPSSRALRWHFESKKARKQLLSWYLERRRDLPWRSLWREHQDPYHVWVSEIMLQQTVIKAVLPVYSRFLKEFPTLRHLAAASDDSVRQAVRGLGYYRRFRMLHAASQQLVGLCSKTGPILWPATFDAWKELPGIGDYTASAISSIAFNYPAAVVDGNVERVFCRLLDLREPPNTPALKKAFKLLAQELLDQKAPGDFNQAVMELGQTVCTLSSPACGACPLQEHCLAFARSSQALAPAAKIKTATQVIGLRLTICKAKNARTKTPALYALVARPDRAKFLKGTFGFLTAVNINGQYTYDGLSLPSTPLEGQRIGRIKHTITQHKIAAEVEVTFVSKSRLPSPLKWLHADQVEENLLANLDRKAWHLYLAFMRSKSEKIAAD